MKSIILAILTLLISFVSYATIGPITGDSSVCVGSIDTLRDSTAGGRWISSNISVGTIDSVTGVLTGITAGVTTITYTVDTNHTTRTINVNTFPFAGTITGDDYICPWGTLFTDSISGGVWGITDTVYATISTDSSTNQGYSVSLSAAIPCIADTITYTVTNSCGSTAAIFPVEVCWPCEGGVNVVSQPTISIQLYPNPVSNELIITSANKITAVTITNLLGQTDYTHQYNAARVQVDVADLPTGVYFVKINGTEVRKFVKE